MACTFILSGLRLVDIQDPYNPKEIAYYNGPPQQSTPGAPTSIDPVSSFAMSKAAFVPERGEIWYTDGNSSFYALRLTNGVAPLLLPKSGPSSAPIIGSGSSLPNTSDSLLVVILGLALAVWLAVAMGLGLLGVKRKTPPTLS